MDNVLSNFWLNGGPLRGITERKQQEDEGEVLRTNINDYTIDSCNTFDEGYETAIWYKDNEIVIVERYYSKKDMNEGHSKWCEFCKSNPKEVYSVQYDKMVNLVEEE